MTWRSLRATCNLRLVFVDNEKATTARHVAEIVCRRRSLSPRCSALWSASRPTAMVWLQRQIPPEIK